MKRPQKTYVVLLLVSGISACGNSEGISDNAQSVNAVETSEVIATDGTADVDRQGLTNSAVDANNNDNDNDNNDNNGNNNNNGGNNNQRNNNRSPQGIPDNGDDRRNNARGQREQNRPRGPLMVDNTEVRSFDGSDNNQAFPEWGSTFSHLQRIGAANYSDGVSSMVYTDKAGAREISNTIVNQEAGENIPNPFGTSDFNWQWGQFIDHDIDLTDGSADDPHDISVPTGDRYFDPAGSGTAVIPFNRALFDPDTGTDATNVREQENEISSWIDGSMVYGSTDARAAALRVGPDSPFLKTSSGNLLPFNTESLVNANGPVPDPTALFLAGDIRVNEQVGLAAMHTLFVREHNRLARLLSDNNPTADAESIFQAARRLVVAEIQIITYNEHLPALIGPNAIPSYRGYDASINPTIYNEFSAAAYRLGHSMVSEQLLRISADGDSISDGALDLDQAFFRAPQLLRNENDIDPILRGLATQVHQSIDVKVIHPLRNLLFGAPGSGGLDLTALNIQRGRDHGLPSYTEMREIMGLSQITQFSQISNDAELNQSLQDAYGDVSKIDLWIGGLAEAALTDQGSQLGELFQAILVKQFTELRDGDRFWYENYLNADELSRVQNVTLATVIRNNTEIGNELQNNVFYASP